MRRREGEKGYRFVILKNYPECRSYEIFEPKKDPITILLERLGLKKERL